MKKRITALLLCLVMALSLIPTTAWAADMSWTWTVTIIGTKYCRPDGSESSTNRYTVNQHLDNSVEHEIGYTFQYVKGAGDGTYDGGWQLCLTVDGKVVEKSTAYIFSRNMENASGTWTTPKSSHTGNSSHPFTLFASDYPKVDPITPEIPDPNPSEILAGNIVTVDDTTNRHADISYPVAAADLATAKKVTDKTWTVTINSNNYVPSFNASYNVEHTLTNAAQQTITLTYSNGKWSASPATVTFTVVCEEDKPADPTKPTDDEVKNLLTQNITVVDDTDLHAKKNYKLKDVANSFTVGEVTTKNDQFVCPVTIKFQPFVDQYSKDVGKTHTLIKNSQTETVVELVASYDKESSTWTWTAAKADRYATIYVECKIPAAPSADEIAKLGKVRVICNTNDKHETKVYDLIPGTYTTTIISQLTGNPVESEVYYDDVYEQFVFDIAILNQDEYGADSVDGIAPYVDKYVKEFGAHAVVDTFTMCTLAYNEESGAWELLKGMVLDPDTDEAVLDEYYGAARISVQCVNDPTAKDLKDLGVTVDVDCKTVKHTAKDYGLTGNETLTVTKKEANGVWTATVSLSDDSAKAFLKQYSKDIGESHTELLTNGTIDLVFEDGAWKLADAKKNVLNITTNCSTTGGNTNPGTTPGTRRPYTKAETKTVESGKTFDAGIAMYVGLSILSLTGSAVVIRKRKDF